MCVQNSRGKQNKNPDEYKTTNGLPQLEGGQGCWGGGVGELGEVDVGDWFTELALFDLFFYERAEIFWAISIHPNGICSGVYSHKFYIAWYVTIILYNRFITKTPGKRTLVGCWIDEHHLRILTGNVFDQVWLAKNSGWNLTPKFNSNFIFQIYPNKVCKP